MRYRIAVSAMLVASAAMVWAEDAVMTPAPKGTAGVNVHIMDLLPDTALTRAGRSVSLTAGIRNGETASLQARVILVLPDGVRLTAGTIDQPLTLLPGEEKPVRWVVEAAAALYAQIRVEVRVDERVAATDMVPIRFLPRMDVLNADYIPAPDPVDTEILVGAHHCPLWEADRPGMWANVRRHPERTPALGFYAQENPEVADWETKWASEHGISFFIYCWYRASQGEPVDMRFGSHLHDAFFKSRYQDNIRFTIMWENQVRGRAGVADETDLMENLFPFWMENYFKHPSYLVLDNRPVLFIYRPLFLLQDLGGGDNVVAAFKKMRQACRNHGFDGLYLLGEYRGLDPNHLRQMQEIGLDYTFAYCWHVPNSPTPDQAIAAQMNAIRRTRELDILPQVVTVSQAWSGWHDEGSIWKIPPPRFEQLLRQARSFIANLPDNELGRRLLILDNWNEWGEGHYLAPYCEFGFGYVDAVRRVFAKTQAPHIDLIPGDLGMGPYDTAYRNHVQQDAALRRRLHHHATKPGHDDNGLISWWAFDEEPETPIALDYSGHGIGGALRDATRAQGIDGQALVCNGGSVDVPAHPALSITDKLTISCWVYTDTPDQGNNWVVNRVFSGGINTGYRLGVLDGKPCFEIPLTDWSHHLSADIDLPTGRWVHLAGTFDGTTMSIYVDGVERGQMERPGPIKPNDFHLCLGSYEVGHPAFFRGLLDEVRLYDRALPAAEIARLAHMYER